ncbi:MAG: hypothetical protein ABI939_03440 [Anaerolineaceae bacterium]
MSLIKVFTDAFKKAAGSKPDATELARSQGGSLGSVPASEGGSFTPLRPAPTPLGGAQSGDLSGLRNPPGSLKVEGVHQTGLASSDPQEGGEITGLRPPGSLKVEGVNTSPLASSDPQEGGEVTGLRRPPTGLKVEGVRETGLASSDPQEGGEVTARRLHTVRGEHLKEATITVREAPDADGEVTGLRRPPTGLKLEGTRETGLASSDPQEGGEVTGLRQPPTGLKVEGVNPTGGGPPASSDHFDIKMEHVVDTQTPAAPAGTPIPYPNTANAPHDIPIVHYTDKSSPSLMDSASRKAGGDQKEFLKVEMKEAVITRDAPSVVDRESTQTDHKGEISLVERGSSPHSGVPQPGEHPASPLLADKSDVHDSHDRLANLGVGHSDKLPVGAPVLDDHFESSTLLNLKPSSGPPAMLPGLAGHLPDSLDLHLDPHADVDADNDESEL